MQITIRPAIQTDVPAMLGLVQELALYEKAPQEVTVTLEEMTAAGFGPGAIWKAFVSIVDGKLVGMSLYFTKYSTWKGKCMYIDDIIVTESMRGAGIGKLLFEETVAEAKRTHMRRLEWQVLEWNTPAINFYNKFSAVLDPEWVNGKLTYEQLQAI
jgi:GNAT superfamily N-acetyltransferase